MIDSDDEVLNIFSSDSRIVDSICSGALTRFNLDHKTKNYNSSEFTCGTPNLSQTPRVLETQLSQEDMATTDSLLNKYFMFLQTLSTSEQGAFALYSKCECVINLFQFYLNKCLPTFNDWEIKSSQSLKSCISDESLTNFICITSIINCLIPDRDSTNAIKIEDTFFVNLFTLCKYYLSFFKELVKNNQIELSIEQNLNLAKSNINDLIRNLNGLEQNKHLDEIIKCCINMLN
ncbi:hypothetical protein BpHYR1_027080 [Brachionus plicatilis]|uniref:Uncharacterized protein n=1 Tax=Brachionus plicatilis TaxID=10195 RepID=A0A3M7P5D7_BRAPC|nr:hypothetical protein BpHYR1_027080 [Brachionus plicatilis]